MSVTELIEAVETAGGMVALNGDKLHVKSPRSLLEQLKACKAEVMAELERRAGLLEPGPESDDRLAEHEERAAIREHEGGLSQTEAETAAAQGQGFDDASRLHRAFVTDWLERLQAMQGRAYAADQQRLIERLLELTRQQGVEAARHSWGAISLFGVDPTAPRPARQRRDRHGAFIQLAESVLDLQVVAIDRDAMVVQNRTGDPMRMPRFHHGCDEDARPIWESCF